MVAVFLHSTAGSSAEQHKKFFDFEFNRKHKTHYVMLSRSALPLRRAMLRQVSFGFAFRLAIRVSRREVLVAAARALLFLFGVSRRCGLSIVSMFDTFQRVSRSNKCVFDMWAGLWSLCDAVSCVRRCCFDCRVVQFCELLLLTQTAPKCFVVAVDATIVC
jgi:hypothetical protein